MGRLPLARASFNGKNLELKSEKFRLSHEILKLFLFAIIALIPDISRATSFTCEQIRNSDTACDFVIVENTNATANNNTQILHPSLKYIDNIVVLGSETANLPDTYLNKLYCLQLTSAFRDQLQNKPDQKQLLEKCIILKTVEKVNLGGYFGPTEPIVPKQFYSTAAVDRVQYCFLSNNDLANRPYNYETDTFPTWWVTLKPNGKYAFGASLTLVTQEESEQLSVLCHGKWYIDNYVQGVHKLVQISDFSVPTYLGFEQAEVNNHDAIKHDIEIQNRISNGFVLHFKEVSNWYIFYSEMFWEAKVTNNSDENGPPVTADHLIIRWSYIDPVTGYKQSGTQNCGSSSYCTWSNRIYVYPAVMPLKLCGYATAAIDKYALGVALPKGETCWMP